jgi:hypothetical protein
MTSSIVISDLGGVIAISSGALGFAGFSSGIGSSLIAMKAAKPPWFLLAVNPKIGSCPP